MGYDSWLEAPYQERAAAAEAFVDWCEANDVDPDDANAERLFEEAMEAAQEDAELDAYEARMEMEMDNDW